MTANPGSMESLSAKLVKTDGKINCTGCCYDAISDVSWICLLFISLSVSHYVQIFSFSDCIIVYNGLGSRLV